MPGPGEYVPDATECVARIEDLPAARLRRCRRSHRSLPCPRCGRDAGRHAVAVRILHDLGDPVGGRPIDLEVTFSRHRCPACGCCFAADLSDLASPYCQYTRRVQDMAVRLVAEDGMPCRDASWHLWRDHRVFAPYATIQNWVEAAGGKCRQAMPGAYLAKALARFSGYLAVDEVYDGPFCVLCVVDNRAFNRLACAVLDHAPKHEDVLGFRAGFKAGLDKRGKAVAGITTDGSQLYPKALAGLWPGVPHQVCEFHVLKEITKAVLHALAGMRKRMKAEIPKRKRGRPPKEEEAAARRIAEKAKRVADLFEGRHLFVRHGLSAGQKEELRRLTSGLPKLRVLRGIMDEVCRLFDRRCKTETALAKLETLRKRVRRLKSLGKALDKLKSPTLEKALEFLDDKLLPSTSNAVERSNRRFRKAQRAVYGVRTKKSLEQRIALDMHREQRAGARRQTTHTLHKARKIARNLH
jgi:hypothetical protein